MKASVYTEYGAPEVLHIQEVAKPTPKDNEVLIRIHATAVNFGDLLARNFKASSPRTFNMPLFFWLMARLAFGLQKPTNAILGNEFAGEVEAIGKAVTRFKVGDPVFGYRGQSMGAYAEYICMPENGVMAPKPANMTYEEAAAVPMGAITAWNILNRQNIQPGQKVLINGASGGIGSYAVQIAKHFGAEVTGVCSTPRIAMVKALGADKVMDYTQEDFTQSGETYDFIFDVLGKGSFGRSQKVLKPNGRYVYMSFKMKQVFQMLWTSLTGSKKKVICALAPERLEDLLTVKALIEAGEIQSIIDRYYPLEQTAEAHRYSETGQKTGHVIIKVA